MQTAAAAQVLLAVVLLVSGTAKALDREGTRTAAVGLGVPPSAAGSVALLLPAAELLAAVLLVAAPVAGLALALLLLAAFTVAVAAALASGRRPTCRCFGRLGGTAVSGRTLVRNGALLAAGVLALALGPARPGVPALLLGAALAAALVGLEARDGRDGGAPGPVPAFTAPLLDGGTTSRDALLAAGRPLLLVVLAPGCGGCAALVPSVRDWSHRHGDRLSVAVVGLTSPGFVRDLVGDLPVPVLVDEDGALRRALGVHETPGAVLVDPATRLGRPAHGVRGVERLVEQALVRV